MAYLVPFNDKDGIPNILLVSSYMHRNCKCLHTKNNLINFQNLLAGINKPCISYSHVHANIGMRVVNLELDETQFFYKLSERGIQ